MKSSIKYALLLGLASSTSLANSSEFYNNKYDQDKGLKGIATSQTKMAKTTHHIISLELKSFHVKQVQINLEGIDNPENYAELYSQYIGKEITNKDVIELHNNLYQALVRQDYLLPEITIMENKSSKGELIINIKSASINDVIIMGEGDDNELMQEYSKRILAAKPARVKYTQRYLALMNKIPGYEVQYQLEPRLKDIKAGTAAPIDLVIVTKRSKGEAYAGIDNYGNSNLGKIQLSAMSQIYSPFGGNDSLLFHANSSNHPNRLYDFGLGYSRIINSYGTSISAFASHSLDNPTKGYPFSAKDGTGNNARIALNHHLFLASHQDLEGEIGINYKNSTSYVVNDQNLSTKNKKSTYWSGDIGLKYLFKDKFGGKNLFNIQFIQGLGGKFTNNIAKKSFNLVKLNMYRDQPLANNFSLFLHATAAYSNSLLPDSELFTLGGRDFGRGYDFGTLDGNRIYAMSSELRYTKTMENSSMIKHIQPYLFVDNGYVGKQNSNTNISRLTSYGGGLRFKFDYDIELGAELAAPAKKNYIIDGVSEKAKTKFGIFINKLFKF